MKVVEKAILSTDLALYFRKKTVFQEVANTGEIDWQGEEKKDRKTIYVKYHIFNNSYVLKYFEVVNNLPQMIIHNLFQFYVEC